ncbi:rhomboid family intramembrane serine protease [bacterium]|nr:rhomboid family intramembrane serine protease [bacterium]
MAARSFGTYSTSMIPNTVRLLLILNVAVFLLQQLFDRVITYYFGLIPALFWSGYIWQPVSYMFLHGGFFHIFFNMFVLWMFGRTLETIWGPSRFLKYYFICGIGAGLLNALITPGSGIPIVGASGAIYGLLLAFGVLFPNQPIYLYFLFPVKAKYFVIGLVVIEFISGFNPASPVAHFAHLGGMLFGFVYLQWPKWKLKMRSYRGEQARKQHLKVVYRQEDEVRKLQKEVDDLLDKINKQGLDALSTADKKRLEEASRKLREWEKQR